MSDEFITLFLRKHEIEHVAAAMDAHIYSWVRTAQKYNLTAVQTMGELAETQRKVLRARNEALGEPSILDEQRRG